MPESKSVRIGQRIKELREEKNLSQANLAQKIGITTRTLQTVERGASLVSKKTLFKIGNVLGFDPHEFESIYSESEYQDAIPTEFLEDEEARQLIGQYDELTEEERKEIFDGAHMPKNTRH